MTSQKVQCQLGDQELTIETGLIAKQAGGSVLVRCGESVILTVATSAPEPKAECDFLPLTVEYLEKYYAAGKIPGGFFKREGRPNEAAILTARLTDRPIRPLFPDNYYFDTQVITTVLSATADVPPDTLSMIGASAALSISDIPLKKPIAGCRVGRIDGKFIVNPSIDQQLDGDLNLVVAASDSAVVMVEGEAEEASEEDVLAAIQFAFDAVQPVIQIQKDLMAKVGKPKREVPAMETKTEITEAVKTVEADVVAAVNIDEKLARYAKLAEIKKELKAKVITEESTYAEKLQLSQDFDQLKSSLMRGAILKEGKRIGGRGPKDIRNIDCLANLLPRAHGSSLFTRGETQALVVCTLGAGDDEQRIDGLVHEESKSFMLNYNFPAYSVGEVRPLRSPGRREVGHGHLAERALARMLPDCDEFPYTVRIVSEIMESNGSSSMASVCGGSLAMMDAGVPLKAPVAGIAMGLIKEDSDFAILSDILGDEDHLGDMDFKVTGTEKGITAVQMDIKIEGITTEITKAALDQAREGRLHILGKMAECLGEHRNKLAEHAPQFHLMKIKVDKIKDLIGPGGKNIKGIVEETGAKIDIDDDGSVRIFSSDGSSIDRTVEMVKELTDDVEIDRIYEGTVKRVVNFGAFVEIKPKVEGLLHISQIADERIENVTDVVNEGDVINVKVLEVDSRSGKIRLSMKSIEQKKAG